MKMLETKAKCIDSTYSMTFLIVRITKHWSNTLLKLKYRICHVKRKKISLNPSFVFGTQAFIQDLGLWHLFVPEYALSLADRKLMYVRLGETP